MRDTSKAVRFVEQLRNEYAISQRFRHPALRRSIAVKLRRNWLARVVEAALVMEMVEGTPIDQQPVEDVPEVLDCFIQTAHALSAMHYMRLVHCDLKPNNIIWTPDHHAKIIDFGQACPIGTVKRRIQGTPDYIAPEQVRCKPVTVQTDVFNFGATLYWALSGHKTPTLFTVGKAQRGIIREQRYPSPRELNPAVPQKLSDLVMACVRMKPHERPQDVSVVLAHLELVREQLT